MGLTIERGRQLVTEFCIAYPAALQVGFRVRSNAQQLYGTQTDFPDLDRLLGAFVPATGPDVPGRCDLACANALHDDDFRQTLRHELIGHFGINTYQPAEKRSLLSALIRSRDHPDLVPLWALAERTYALAPTFRLAEEVFSLACETVQDRTPRGIEAEGRAAMTQCAADPASLSGADLRAVAEWTAHRMRQRQLRIGVFPPTEREQFDRPGVVAEGHFVGPATSLQDGWIEQRIGRSGRTIFHASELLSETVSACGSMVEVKYTRGLGKVTARELGRDMTR